MLSRGLMRVVVVVSCTLVMTIGNVLLPAAESAKPDTSVTVTDASSR